MRDHSDKSRDKGRDNPRRAVARRASRGTRDRSGASEFPDNRPEATISGRLQEIADNSPQAARAARWRSLTPSRSVGVPRGPGPAGPRGSATQRQPVVQRFHYASIGRDIADDALAGYDFNQFPTDQLQGLSRELGQRDQRDAQAAVDAIIGTRTAKESEYRREIGAREAEVAALRREFERLDAIRGALQAEIDANLDFLERTHGGEAVPGLAALVRTIKAGRDSWEKEAAPYLRELFLGISEMGLGRVQFGAIGGTGGDVVYGRGTPRLATVQSKYFTTADERAVVADLTKAINQLGGSGGETPEVGSRRVADTVIDNPEWEAELNLATAREIIRQALAEATTRTVDEILIALPHQKVQYRATVTGDDFSVVRIGIEPQRFDLPELHQTLRGESFKDLFARRDRLHVALRDLGDQLDKAAQGLRAFQGLLREVHQGVEPDEPVGFSLFGDC